MASGKTQRKNKKSEETKFPKILFVFRRELMEENNMSECAVSGRNVRDPICVACLEEQMEQWLNERDETLVPELRNVADEAWLPFKGGDGCIKCGMPANVREEYFVRHVMIWMTQYPHLLPEFVKFFNCTPMKEEIVVIERPEGRDSIRAVV